MWQEHSGGMSKAIVRTVLGDIGPESLGRTSIHEHIVLVGSLATIREPEFRLDDLDRVAADVAAFRNAGGGALVDTMPLVEGRSADSLVTVSQQTGVHVVACTGFHSPTYYTESHWLRHYAVDRLAELLVTEIVEGMDELCFNGPDRRCSTARAGVIKIAGGFHHVPSTTRRAIEAAGIAHLRTGAPVLAHVEQGTAAHELLDLLEPAGVPAARVLLSHMDRNPDPILHVELVERGAMLSYDWLARTRNRPDSVVTDLVLRMVERGHAASIGIGMDLVRHTYWPAYGGGPGLRYLFGEFVPRMARAGVPEEALQAICVGNPARFLSFQPKEIA